MTAISSPTRVEVDEMQQRRRWLATALGTAVITVSMWAFLFAFFASADAATPPERAMAAVALGMALMPAAFVTIAFVSGHQSPALATLRAMATSLVVGIPVLAIVQDGLSGLVAGFGVGAAFALRPSHNATVSARIVAVGIATFGTFLLVHALVPLALASAPSLPLLSVVVADRRNQDEHHEHNERCDPGD